MKRVFTVVGFVLLNNMAFCQWDLFFDSFGADYSDKAFSAGYSVMNHSNLPKPTQGINISYGSLSEKEIKNLEFLRAFYLEANFYFKQRYQDFGGFNAFSIDSINQQSIYVPYEYNYSLRYQSFNAGIDYYFHSYTLRTFDLYAGWQLGIHKASYTGEYDFADYDKQNYKPESESEWQDKWSSKILSPRAGLKIGGDIQIVDDVGLYFETVFSRTFKEIQVDPNFHLQGNSFVNFNFGIKFYSSGYY